MKIRKMIAPIVITILLIAYLIFFALSWRYITTSLWVKVVGTIIPLILAGVSIFVLIERIKEIRSGEEDDLSKY